MTIPERLRKMRVERKISMKFCAESSGIPYNTYQKYEYGEREISITAIQKLANFYGVSTDYLLGREADSLKPDPIAQLSKAETEEDFLKKYFMLDPELRAKVREKMQEALKQQQETKDDNEYITYTTTIGAEMDRRKAIQRASELDDDETKKNAV